MDRAVCGHGRVVVCAEHTAERPNGNEAYSLVVHDGFAPMEWDGWIARVTFDLPGNQGRRLVRVRSGAKTVIRHHRTPTEGGEDGNARR